MCLITFSYQQHPKYPFIMVANRDEFYKRSSSAMAFWQDHCEILAGRDLEKQGTWLGLHTSGKLSAVTNYRNALHTPQQPLLSRGQLITQSLLTEHSSVDFLDTLAPRFDQYGPCSLLTGDQHGLYFASNQPVSSDQSVTSNTPRRLAPGIYGLCNASLDTPWPKLLDAKAQLQQLLSEPQIRLAQLQRILNDNRTAPEQNLPNTGIAKKWERSLSAQFIQLENYGTRAKSIILQHLSGKTEICEISYDRIGVINESYFELQLPLIGGSINKSYYQ